MNLIVGLGNPGEQYKFTRHNFGWLAVEFVAKKYKLRFRIRNNLAVTPICRISKSTLTSPNVKSHLILKGNNEEIELVLAKPLTYVNQSGLAVHNLINWFRNKIANLIIVYDDFSLPLGTIRIRQKGSSGGHKGIDSIIQTLPKTEFVRIRLGIGPLPQHLDPKDFVLASFLPEEKPKVTEIIPIVDKVLETIFVYGIDKTVSQFNSILE